MTNKDLDRLLELIDKEWNFTFKDEKEYKSLKVKLEGELEKAKKWDKRMRCDRCKRFLSNGCNCIVELEQENKQLKEELEHYKIHDEDLIKLVTTHQLVSIEEYQNLKQKLEKIEELLDTMGKHDIHYELRDKLKKILEEHA